MLCALLWSSVSVVRADVKFQLYQNKVRKEAASSGFILHESFGKSAQSKSGTFNQILDHFSRPRAHQAPITFKQRYFVDSTYAKSTASPVIFYICGESTCEGPTDSAIVNELAKTHGAYRVALEHRYYGYSQPFPSLTTANLRYLSMDQAIEDLAYFEIQLKSQLGLTGKWIAVGGSYPGEVSAFFRMRHPELVAGALASSAPVFAKSDFFEYDRHVARVANPGCLSVIQKVIGMVEVELKKSPMARIAVKKLFNAEAVEVDEDFLYDLADMGAIAIQYGYQDQFCGALTEGDRKGKALEAYAEAGTKLFQDFGTNALKDSFQGAMSLDPKDYLDAAGRQWMYQSCTEFGFYQIANSDPRESARSSRITLQYHHDACKRLFGINQPVDVERTNRSFYHQLFAAKTDRVLFTNGSNDPWSNLSLTDPVTVSQANPGLSVFLISGAAHCEDLGSRFTHSIQEAKSIFKDLFARWISE